MFGVSIALLLALIAGSLYDLLIPYVHAPPCGETQVAIFDVEGCVSGANISAKNVVVIKSMSVEDFVSLGRCGARLVIIVAHGLRVVASLMLPRGSYAIETSQTPSIDVFFRYPLYIALEAVVRGKPFNVSELRVAVTRNIIPFMYPLGGKVVVLLTCPAPRIKSFAKELVSKGASLVIYPTKPVNPREIRATVLKIINAFGKKGVEGVVKVCRSLGFEVVHGTT